MKKQPHGITTEDRSLAAICLLVVAGTHLPLVAEHLEEAPLIGYGFIGLVAASMLLAAAVSIRASTATWAAIGVLNLGALTAYVASRTVGLPGIGDDIGNWVEPLSFPALAAETVALAVAVRALLLARVPRAQIADNGHYVNTSGSESAEEALHPIPSFASFSGNDAAAPTYGGSVQSG